MDTPETTSKEYPTSDAELGHSPFHTRLVILASQFKSVRAYATAVGISQGGLQRLLNGGEPTLSTLVALAHASDVTVEWLATGTGKWPPHIPKPSDGVAERVPEADRFPESLYDTLPKRITYITEKVGGSAVLAPLLTVTTTTLLRWRKGETEPSASQLLEMARAGGVSVEWLVAGSGGSPVGESNKPVSPATHHETQPARPFFDAAKMEAIVLAVDEALKEKNKDLPTDKKAKIFSLIYEQAAKDEAGFSLDEYMEKLLSLF